MVFHTYGNKENKAVILLHGMLTPYQIWDTATEYFSRQFYVVVPELDGHTENEKSTFISVEDEVNNLIGYIRQELNGKVYLLAGLSMGGRIAAELSKSDTVSIEYLVLDGAPLMKTNSLLMAIMRKNYWNIICSSQKRDPKVKKSFKKDFLPETYWEPYLKIADNMERQSVDNILDSVFSPFEFISYPENMKILFMHGTKANEKVSRKGALKMKEHNQQMKIRCFDGLAHAELACFKQDQWIREVEDFIKL